MISNGRRAMQMSADIEFYVRRERQERQLAERARDTDGRRVHLELARCYAQLIADAGEGNDRSDPA
jgi:hypothetical protein